jgi:type I restriction enzyme, S subunit
MREHLLPSNWRAATIAEIAAPVANAIVDGPFGSNLKLSDYVERGVPVLQGKNITNDTFQWFDVRFISDRKANELKRSSVRVGDILLVKIGSIGYSAIVQDLQGFDFAIIPANLAKITPDSATVDTGYLHRWLTSPDAKRYLTNVASKTAQPALSLGKIKNLPVPLPPLAKQRRIAEVLNRAESLRVKRRAAIAQLDTLTQSIFSDLLARVEQGGYASIALGDAVELVTVGHVGPTSEFFCDVGVPFLRTGNIGNFEVVASDLKHITPEFHKKLKKSALKEDDVLVSRVISDEVRCAVVPAEFNGANCANVIVIRPGARMTGQYIAHLIRSPRSQHAFLKRQVGSAQSVVNTGVLQNWPVVLPPVALQFDFSRRVAAVEKLKAVHRASLSEMDALFASLQHRAFRGEL